MAIDEKQHDREGGLTEVMVLVDDALSRLRYGSIQLTVHDGKVMQVDVTERKRLHG